MYWCLDQCPLRQVRRLKNKKNVLFSLNFFASNKKLKPIFFLIIIICTALCTICYKHHPQQVQFFLSFFFFVTITTREHTRTNMELFSAGLARFAAKRTSILGESSDLCSWLWPDCKLSRDWIFRGRAPRVCFS